MDTIPALMQAFGNLFQPIVFLAVFVATIASIVVGVLPAVSGGLLVIMILPFMFGADPVVAMPVLCALVAASGIGGSVTAVLTGIPGDSANSATVMDGFAMTRKGEGGRALGLALSSNVLSALFGVGLSILIIPLMKPILLSFKSVEMFLIIVLALMFLSVLTKGSRVKGLISAGIGLTLSCVGFQSATGIDRLTFGNLYLYDGIEVATVLMGILAVPTLFELVAEGVPIAPEGTGNAGRLSELLRGAKEVFTHHLVAWFRGTLIGFGVGIAPALGSTTAVWIAYAQAKQSAKNENEFGTGAPQGIVVPEGARAVCAPGDLLTTLVFGIPGNSIMVVILAAFLMMGVQPGPTLVIEHTALAFQMILTIGLSILLGAIVLFFGSPLLVKITRVSPYLMFSWLIPLIILGAYVTREFGLDIIVIGITSLLGLCLKRFGFSAPAIIMGFVMGDLFEKYLGRSLDLYGTGFFWSSPSAIVLTALIVLSIVWGPAKSMFDRIRGGNKAQEGVV
jgi:TctA family transporter